MNPWTAAPALPSAPAPGPELPPHFLRMIPVDPTRPPAETLDFVRRCTRCGAAKLELVRDCGQWVCADSCHQARAWGAR